jgi:hypothetical protein
MRHNRLLCIAALLLALLFLPACSDDRESGDPASDATRVVEQSGVWKLNERYPVTYSSLNYIVTYDANGVPFCLKVTRNKKEPGMSQRVIDHREVDGIIFALCESKQLNADQKAANTYYECYTGSFRYYIGREGSDGFYIENYLSMDDAIALMKHPSAPKGAVRFIEEEWNALYRTKECSLEILIRPNDGGKLCRTLSSSYAAVTEGDDTYYVSNSRDDVVYTNGVHSVQIRQATFAGAASETYNTLSECKAILALIG